MQASPILVTGGTGTLGRLVVARLRNVGHDLRVFSRGRHASIDGIESLTGDLLANEGIEPAVEGAEIVLHLAGGPKGDDEATRNLVRAASRAGTRHLVYISVIGADRVPLRYFRSKLAAEQAVAGSGLPFTTLRAAQFHEIVLTMARMLAKLPVLPVPSAVRLQPVDADEVAARLVELALGEPAGRVPDLAGPKVYPLADLLDAYLRARGKRRPRLPIHLPGQVGRAYRAGENLSRDGSVGQRTWEDFLGSSGGAGYSSSRSTPSLKRRSAA